MLPIKKVVLYKHGVGYFEREGEIEGDASITLHFKSNEMNDVLKSLTVLDLSGGIVSSISYESTKPVEKQLEDIAIRLPDGNAVTGLLSQVKGAKIKVTVGTEEVVGIVTGIEDLKKQVDNSTITTFLLSILVDGQTLKSYDIMEIKSLSFLDENLKKDLSHLLEILISAKKKDAKKLTIYARGSGKRELLAAYVVETPVWKASYRTLLGEDKPTIQGWALVDNTQDEDWENVCLTLVAGLPISFVHDLYSPRYKKRPVVEVKEEEAYAPPIMEEGIAFGGMAEEFEAPCDFMAGAGMLMAKAPEAPAPSRSRAVMRREARAASVPVQTRTVEVGDLFQYEIKNPVTVNRNQSALVPILQSDFEGKKVAVYNEGVREKNPMSALLIKNTTGLTLEGGPMTVLENETYVGEAMLDTLKPGEERIVPFSVELGCLVTREKKSERHNIHRVRISGGYMYLDYFQLEINTYLVKNKVERDLDLFLEHRFNYGWELIDTPDPYEKTENFYRFRFNAPAKKSTTFTVTEKNQQYQSWNLRNINPDQIEYWSQNGYIDWNTKRKLDDLMKIVTQIADLTRQISELEREQEDINGDQKRLRENLKALGASVDEKKLRERYVSDMGLQEDRLKQIRQSIKELNSQNKKHEKEMEKSINSMDLKRDI